MPPFLVILMPMRMEERKDSSLSMVESGLAGIEYIAGPHGKARQGKWRQFIVVVSPGRSHRIIQASCMDYIRCGRGTLYVVRE